MKQKINTGLLIWKIIGLILMIWTLFWYIKKTAYSGPYFITLAYFYTIGLFLLILHIIISILMMIYKYFKKTK